MIACECMNLSEKKSAKKEHERLLDSQLEWWASELWRECMQETDKRSAELI